MAGISSLTAAQLSQAAYPNNPPPAGWTSYRTVSTPDGTNSMTIFVNSATEQAVFAFKGTDNLSNLQSDLENSGGSAWLSLQPIAPSALQNFERLHFG